MEVKVVAKVGKDEVKVGAKLGKDGSEGRG